MAAALAAALLDLAGCGDDFDRAQTAERDSADDQNADDVSVLTDTGNLDTAEVDMAADAPPGADTPGADTMLADTAALPGACAVGKRTQAFGLKADGLIVGRTTAGRRDWLTQLGDSTGKAALRAVVPMSGGGLAVGEIEVLGGNSTGWAVHFSDQGHALCAPPDMVAFAAAHRSFVAKEHASCPISRIDFAAWCPRGWSSQPCAWSGSRPSS